MANLILGGLLQLNGIRMEHIIVNKMHVNSDEKTKLMNDVQSWKDAVSATCDSIGEQLAGLYQESSEIEKEYYTRLDLLKETNMSDEDIAKDQLLSQINAKIEAMLKELDRKTKEFQIANSKAEKEIKDIEKYAMTEERKLDLEKTELDEELAIIRKQTEAGKELFTHSAQNSKPNFNGIS